MGLRIAAQCRQHFIRLVGRRQEADLVEPAPSEHAVLEQDGSDDSLLFRDESPDDGLGIAIKTRMLECRALGNEDGWPVYVTVPENMVADCRCVSRNQG